MASLGSHRGESENRLWVSYMIKEDPNQFIGLTVDMILREDQNRAALTIHKIGEENSMESLILENGVPMTEETRTFGSYDKTRIFKKISEEAKEKIIKKYVDRFRSPILTSNRDVTSHIDSHLSGIKDYI